MNASYEWLRAFVPFDLDPAQLRDVLTEHTATVDELQPLRADLAAIVVARVVEVAPHPDSDRLWLTKVDAGGGALVEIVCGAPNVRAGTLYPFAPVGTVMPGGLKIEKRKIRGATSSGMLCSSRELGLGDDSQGILALDVEVAPGTPLLRAMPLGDTRMVIDVTPNRPDLLSHLGIARELGAVLHLPVRVPEGPEATRSVPAPVRAAHEGRAGAVVVRLDDHEGAPRYLGVTIRGVRIGPSPEWLVRRIEAVGGRPISNVVDVTNYVLHELGQPTHAFDLAALADSTIAIRRARRGERLRTLDGIERTLTDAVTVIADGARAQAIAGVMGGGESEVGEGTRDIFLEVANFDPVRTRATRRTLGLSTDASYRFERGVDIELAPRALERAVRLILEVAGGEVEGAPVDLYPEPRERATVALRSGRVRGLLGEPIGTGEIRALLSSVGFGVAVAPGTEMLAGDEELRVIVPSWRPDVTSEADLLEEVARLHGYDRLSDELRPYRIGTVPDAPLWRTSRRVREVLVGHGLLETRPMPFTRGGDEGFVRVANPLAEDEAYLRRDLLDTLARRAEYNLARMQRNIRLFEIGAAFAPASAGELPREQMRVAAIILGDRYPAHFTQPKPPQFDEWDAKGLAELIARAAYPKASVELRPSPGEGVTLWTVELREGGDARRVGAVRRVSLDAPVWAAPAFGVEVMLEELDAQPVAPWGQAAYRLQDASGRAASTPAADRSGRRYLPLPVTPAAEFDLALLVPNAIAADQVEAVLRAQAGELLEQLQLFDEYRGKNVPEGMRSLAWRLTFRHAERTLRDKEVEGRREKLLRALEEELGVRQRTG
jgi:phenylalanyl-tRNA synthetase beta chain